MELSQEFINGPEDLENPETAFDQRWRPLYNGSRAWTDLIDVQSIVYCFERLFGANYIPQEIVGEWNKRMETKE